MAMCFCQFLGPLLGRKGKLGIEEAPGMAFLNCKPSDICLVLLSSVHWLIGEELCSKGPQVLLKALTEGSDELAVTAAATVEGGTLGLGSPKLDEDEENLSLAVAHPSRNQSTAWYHKSVIPYSVGLSFLFPVC